MKRFLQFGSKDWRVTLQTPIDKEYLDRLADEHTQLPDYIQQELDFLDEMFDRRIADDKA